MGELIYADNNATTAVAPEVVEAMRPFFEREYFNPSSVYEVSTPAAEALVAARKQVAGLIGAGSPAQILFTSCATESNNTAIFGAVRANPKRKRVITSAVEHPSVFEVCRELERRGHEVIFVPVDRQGRIDKMEFVRALTPDTLLVTMMHANNETGVVFPIAELARLTKETDPSILFHTDATQTVGKLSIDLKREFRQVDMLSFSGHKMHAPKGIGALFLRRGTPCRPLLIGGHQESGRRAGTENVAFIVGLGRACQLAAERQAEEVQVAELRDHLQETLTESIPYIEVNGAEAERLPNTLNLACHYIEGEGILYQLNSHGIAASSGSACTSGSLEPSHVLQAMDVPFTARHGSIRFSLSRYNTRAEVDRIAQVLPDVVTSLRRLSPYWDSEKGLPREA